MGFARPPERFQTALAGFKSFVCLRPDECGLQWHWFWLAISPGLKMPSERFQTALAGFKSFVCLRPDECGLQWHWFWLAISPGLKMPSESKRNPCVECVP